MKNLLLIAGLGLGVYGLYLIFEKTNGNKQPEDDCGCNKNKQNTHPAALALSTPAPNTDMMPDSMIENYDSSFLGTFRGMSRTDYTGWKVGAGSADDLNTSATIETVTP